MTEISFPAYPLIWQGAYDPARTYFPHDAVQHEGSSWAAVEIVSGVAPGVGSWELVASQGARGALGPPGSNVALASVTAFGAVGLAVETTGSVAAGSDQLSVASSESFEIDQGVLVLGAGSPAKTEQATLTITAGASASGNVRVVLGESVLDIAVVGGDSASTVASKIRSTAFSGWTTGGTGATVTFTANSPGPQRDLSYNPRTTGANATESVDVQGTNQQDLIARITGVSETTLTLDTLAETSVSAARVLHDDTPAIQAAIDAAGHVYFPEVSGGYGVNMRDGLNVLSGRTIEGCGYPGRLKRIGTYLAGENKKLFQNDDAVNGDDDISYLNLWIEGGGPVTGFIPNLLNLVCFKFNARDDPDYDGKCDRGRVVGCTVVDWPGVVIHAANLRHFLIQRNNFIRPQRGGMTLVHYSDYGSIASNVIELSHDDSIAINADGADRPVGGHPAPKRVSVAANVCSVAQTDNTGGTATGQPLALRGATDIAVSGNYFEGGKFANIYIDDAGMDGPTLYAPSGIVLAGNRCHLSELAGVWIKSRGAAKDITIDGGIISNSRDNGVVIEALAGTGFLENITVAPKEIANPGAVSSADGVYADIPQAGGQIVGLAVENCLIVRPQRSGLRLPAASGYSDVTVRGLRVRNANVANVSGASAMHFSGAEKWRVSEVDITDSRPTKTCAFGLNIIGGSNGVYRDVFALNSDHQTSGIRVASGLTNVTDGGGNKT